MPTITLLPTLCFSFSLFSFSRFCYSVFPTLFFFLVLARAVLWWWLCCDIVTLSLWLLLWWWSYCARRRLLYTACRDWFFNISPFNHFCLDVSVATTTYLYWPCHIPLPDKEFYFVCLLIVAFPSGTRWAFSLTISHGMHLVIPTHHSLFWVVCCPNRTFPPK